MLLTLEPMLLLIGVLWMPGFAVLGGGYAALASWAARRGGRRAVLPVWIGSTLVSACAVSATLYARAASWAAHPGGRPLLTVLSLAAAVVAVCLGAVTVVVRQRIDAGARADAGGIVWGAAAAAGAWTACVTLAMLAARLTSRAGHL